ncbi:superoxide dismutase family protein [Acinetobacter sp. SwsAc4]|uniref:superoxide dismutase family protein n=1 Tax=Acinetobacter sp. SwsAc4 TaxID=2749437 RepID=UPI0015C112DB|nr:superoxide dismutase family protein [Acinetobacter sp. SwsAc4]NWK82611.1 superoxide dismutase family protein [Acinetobacter sp. SwsAc4]
MISTVQKSCVLTSLVLMMSACSSINLDSNASKIQTQPTTTDQKQLIQVYQVDAKGVGASIGTVTFKQTAKGLLITPALGKLSPGEHGFHIHENGSCEAAEKEGKMGAALAAGGHLNPEKFAHHGTPLDGHLGDLPALKVNDKGFATTPVLAPRLKLTDIQGRAIMIHAGGDNYSDTPKPLGGGGERIACGVIQS